MALAGATSVEEYDQAMDDLRINESFTCRVRDLDSITSARMHRIGKKNEAQVTTDFGRDRLILDAQIMNTHTDSETGENEMDESLLGVKMAGPRRIHLILTDEMQQSAFTQFLAKRQLSGEAHEKVFPS